MCDKISCLRSYFHNFLALLHQPVDGLGGDCSSQGGGIVTPGEFLRRLNEDHVSLLAAVRWAMMLTESGRFCLQAAAAGPARPGDYAQQQACVLKVSL